MTMETTGQLMTRSLVAHGVDTLFGIPGAHMYDFIDAVHGAGNAIRFIHTRHEQGAAYMAYGYARATGRVGAYTVVPGPGVLNSGAALCTALGANTPVLCLTGNIMSHLIGRGRGQLHELPDQLATLNGLTKGALRINHPHDVSRVMARAFSTMASGRPGPFAVEAPWDVFGKSGQVGELAIGRREPGPEPDPDALKAAAALINGARRPLIMVGGGATEAASEVRELAYRIGAPVTSHRMGKGILPGDDPLSLDFAAAFEYWQDADLLIGVGSRLELQHMRWRWLPKGMKTIRIDVDATEMVRLPPEVGIVADAADGLRRLLPMLQQGPVQERMEECGILTTKAAKAYAVVQPQVGFLAAIRRVLPRDGFFVEEVSQMGFAARFAFPVYGPRQYVSCGYQDNLGFGFNTALGVKVAHPDKAVVSVSGDGGFLFGAQELATAVQHRINVVAIVFNNSAYGNVLRDQTQAYKGHVIGSELVNPDFVRLAQSFGARGFRADTPEGLEKVLAEALTLDAPSLIEVRHERGSEASPWPFIHPAPPQGK